MVAIEGVDYSFARPDPRGLWAAGKRFAVRYGGPGSAGKQLTAGELARLTDAGLAVVANAEGTAGGFTGTAAGLSWARSAWADFRSLGMPADRPIYFSVDWDAGSSAWPGIDAALRAAASVIGPNNVGVYGSYDTIAHCISAGTARWFWQTYAWSGGRLHTRANLYQYKNGVTIAGGDVDLTRALTVDYGQWGQDEMPMTNADADVFINRFADRINNKGDALCSAMRAVAWQYDGGGLQGAPSTLWALSDSQTIKAAVMALAAQVTAINPDVDEAALGAAISAGLVDPLKAALLDALPDDLDATVRAAVEASVEDTAARFRISVDPPAAA